MPRKKHGKAAGPPLSSVVRVALRSRRSQLDESPAPPKEVRGSRRSKRLSVVKSSSPTASDMGTDGDGLGNSYLGGPSRWAVKSVNVPTKSRSGKQAQMQNSNTPSTVSSDFSYERAEQAAIDTPGTSIAPTPAESSTKISKRVMPGTVPEASVPSPFSTASKSAVAMGKMKRTAEQDLIEGDEMIAQALQNEEYASIELQDPNIQYKGKKRLIADSSSESELSEIDNEIMDSELSVDSEPRAKSQGKLRRQKPAKRTKTTVSDSEASSVALSTLQSETDEEFEAEVSSGSGESESDDVEAETSSKHISGRSARTARAVRPNGPKRWKASQMAGTSRAERERMKLENNHPEIVTLWNDLRAIPTIKPERRAQPSDITRKLKPFQLEGLDWMCKQEHSKWKGGLLGDEMGMGKTIQAVSLIMSDYPAKDPTLVVVPPVALLQWSSEIASYTDGRLKVLVHHNSDSKVKKLTVKDLRKYDVIMISYSGLESIYRKEFKGWKRDDGLVKEASRIHAIKYHRLVLDEAHSIKSRTTGVAKACFALQAKYKWCLSGTPVQNRIGEFFSLLRFLEVTPFASYACKSCACNTLHWSQDERKRCTHCGHSGFSHVSIFNQEILNPITTARDAATRKEAFAKLRLITDRIMLRRVKRDNTASMELPPKDITVHREFFSPVEHDFAASIMGNSQRKFNTYVSQGVILNNYANVFSLITRMRQVADHPDLILRRSAEGATNVPICNLCDEPAEEAIQSRCRHDFCRLCVRTYMASFDDMEEDITPDCPRCHISLSIDLEAPAMEVDQDEDEVKKNSIINRINMTNWTSSTKIEMLLYDLYQLRSRKQTQKSIIFSQFTSMLDLVDWRLRRAGFNTVKLDGSMSPMQRQRSIEHFMNNVEVEVFLVSLKAGGVALNLTEASRVFIIDPWWNPSSEWQSADRAHRIGQKRPVSIQRLCIEDSVESRIIQLQAKKASMVASTIDNDPVALDRLAPEDMEFLFRGN